jgi:hypothetical protein
MEDCIYRHECGNAGKSCFKCFHYNMLKPIKEIKRLQPKSDRRKERKEGMAFEKRGTKQYNQAVAAARAVARRQIASGALHFALGDMITEEELTAALAEFKERGSVDAKGNKQITIKKEWLDKLADEAREMGRDYYFLPFSFKGGDKDYVVLEYNILLSYIQTIQTLAEQVRLLQKQLEGDTIDS